MATALPDEGAAVIQYTKRRPSQQTWPKHVAHHTCHLASSHGASADQKPQRGPQLVATAGRRGDPARVSIEFGAETGAEAVWLCLLVCVQFSASRHEQAAFRSELYFCPYRRVSIANMQQGDRGGIPRIRRGTHICEETMP